MSAKHSAIRLFMCGDVMTGRGIDQILPHPSDPALHEPYVKNAVDYVHLAEQADGSIPKPAAYPYIWGDALPELEGAAPDVRIINLETSVTTSNDYWKGKEIHYRMNPANIPCITAARIDCCCLANNHVLDWGYSGLAETLETLKRASVETAGAGANMEQAAIPAVLEVDGKARVLVFSFGSESSGVPRSWAATDRQPGVNFLGDLSHSTVQRIKEQVSQRRRRNNVVVASIHWGANWGYEIPVEQRDFAHRLIDEAGVDVIHGHSSHHVKGVEVHRGKLILYGCGDFLNDYEGIGGLEEFRGDLGLMYFAEVEASTGALTSLRMVPTELKRFRVNRASRKDAEWLKLVLNREGERFGTAAELGSDGALELHWA